MNRVIPEPRELTSLFSGSTPKRLASTMLLVLSFGFAVAADEPRSDPLGPRRPLVGAGDLGGRSVPVPGAGAGPDRSQRHLRCPRRIPRSGRSTSPGTLRFDPESDTRLDVGLIKIQAGDDPGESGFDCEAHAVDGPTPGQPRAALEVGTSGPPDRRGPHGRDPARAGPGARPGRVPGDRLLRRPDGLPRRRAAADLGQARRDGRRREARRSSLAEPVPGWRVGDRVIVTATTHAAASRTRAMYPSVARPARDRGADDPRDRRHASSSSTPRSISTITSVTAPIAARSPT